MNKWLSIGGLLLVALSAFGQSSGETREVDGLTFQFRNNIWVHTDLDEGYEVTEAYSTVHKNRLWQDWYDQGSETLRKILDLGENVIFNFQGADGNDHVYAVFVCEEFREVAIQHDTEDVENEKIVANQKFEYTDGIWLHEALPEDYDLLEDYVTTHKSDLWQKWYDNGSEDLRDILDLGKNVIFTYTGSDQKEHVYAVYACDGLVPFILPVQTGTILGTTLVKSAIIVGTAVVAGVIIVENNNDDGDDSPTKR